MDAQSSRRTSALAIKRFKGGEKRSLERVHLDLTLKSASQFPHLPPYFEASAAYKIVKHVPCVNMTGFRFPFV